MFRFKTYEEYTKNLLLENLNYPEALKLMGLSAGFSADDLKSAYRNLSKKHHPDRGGSTEMMQKVNIAYAMLRTSAGSGNSNGGSTGTRAWSDMSRQERQEMEQDIGEHMLELVRVAFNQERYIKHFEDILGGKFTVKEARTNNSWGTAWITYEISNDDRTTVATLSATVSFSGFNHGNTLAGSGQDIQINAYTEIYHAKRKIKLAQRNWGTSGMMHTLLQDPNELFPADKFAKQTAKASAGSLRFTRKDAFLMIRTQLGGREDKDGVWIDLPNIESKPKTSVYLKRMTFMRQSGWMISGLYQYKLIKHFGVSLTPETEEYLTMFVDAIKHARTAKTVEEATKILADAVEKIKAQCKANGD